MIHPIPDFPSPRPDAVVVYPLRPINQRLRALTASGRGILHAQGIRQRLLLAQARSPLSRTLTRKQYD